MDKCTECQTALVIPVPGVPGQFIEPGCIIKIGRFSRVRWRVKHGWYSYANNRPVYGFFLVNESNMNEIRPLQKPDLNDVYLIEQ